MGYKIKEQKARFDLTPKADKRHLPMFKTSKGWAFALPVQNKYLMTIQDCKEHIAKMRQGENAIRQWRIAEFPKSVTDNVAPGQKEYDAINPQHYKNYSVEVIDMMVRIWGREKTANYCEMCAFKYRQRTGNKPGNAIAQDLKKEKWYLDKATELKTQLR